MKGTLPMLPVAFLLLVGGCTSPAPETQGSITSETSSYEVTVANWTFVFPARDIRGYLGEMRIISFTAEPRTGAEEARITPFSGVQIDGQATAVRLPMSLSQHTISPLVGGVEKAQFRLIHSRLPDVDEGMVVEGPKVHVTASENARPIELKAVSSSARDEADAPQGLTAERNGTRLTATYSLGTRTGPDCQEQFVPLIAEVWRVGEESRLVIFATGSASDACVSPDTPRTPRVVASVEDARNITAVEFYLVPGRGPMSIGGGWTTERLAVPP